MAIYSKVPRLNIELVITGDEGVLLTKRTISPYKDTWHLPGGTVYFGDTLEAAAGRIAKDELGIEVSVGELLGYIEYPSAAHQKEFVGWPIGVAFKAIPASPDIVVNDEAEEWSFFTNVPDATLPDQKAFIERILESEGR